MEKLLVPRSAQSPGKAMGTIPAWLCLQQRPGKPKGWVGQQEHSYVWLFRVLQTCCCGAQDNPGFGQLYLPLPKYTVHVSYPSCRATACEQMLEYGLVKKVMEK